jgi:hypothetical protein
MENEILEPVLIEMEKKILDTSWKTVTYGIAFHLYL